MVGVICAVNRRLLELPAAPDAEVTDVGRGRAEEVALDDLEVAVGDQVDGVGLGGRPEAVGGQPGDGGVADDDRGVGTVLAEGQVGVGEVGACQSVTLRKKVCSRGESIAL